MSTTSPAGRLPSAATRHVLKVGDVQCVVRVTALSPIAEVLGLDAELPVAASGPADAVDATTMADMLDSRMISPPRLRRRRERPVSSRAIFYAPCGG